MVKYGIRILRTRSYFTPKKGYILTGLVKVWPVFERPYHKKNSNEPRSDPKFGVYAHEPNEISYDFFKLQILGHMQLTQLIWPRKNGPNRNIAAITTEPNIFDPTIGPGFSDSNKPDVAVLLDKKLTANC